ncbi:MAG: lipopolysaccharide biosynthesis protein RfbH [Candidatus Omnitrophica bacterium]|nr:lipopolysaccharide biosynthesis protein RfbH [Candidatus Omnitrophota bacterium]
MSHDKMARLRDEISTRVREYYELAHAPKRFVPFESKVPYAGRHFGPEEMQSLMGATLDFWLTLGPYGHRFERALKAYFDARDAILVNSGSSANLLAIATLCCPTLEGHLRPGDEVITPAVTFPTTVAPLVQHQLVPVFVDCELGTYNLDPELVAQAISPRTRAIVVPHTLGNPCDLDALTQLAQQHGLWLMEDCCDALGSTFAGKRVGTFGDLATLSFYPAHHITTGEGGGLIVNRQRFMKIARSIRDWGRDCWCEPGVSNTCGQRFGWQLGDLPLGYDHKYIYSRIGYNLKPTDLQAAIGCAQLAKLDAFIAARRRNFQRLREGLAPCEEFLIFPQAHPKAEPSWFGFPLTVRAGVRRAELVRWLEEAKIETRMIFAGNLLRQPAFQEIAHRVAGSLAQTDRVMQDTFFIGVYPGLTDEMIDFIVERFRQFFQRAARSRPQTAAVGF